jgi:superfamily II DNA/RNA helicase
LIHIDNQTTPREKRVGPNVLVLSPTRELAIQIEQEVKKINYKGIKSVCGKIIFIFTLLMATNGLKVKLFFVRI